MTKDEIMMLANQSSGQYWMDEAHIQRFAALVAAAEREACVKACKAQRQLLGENEAKFGGLGIAMCVDAISTRGQK
jgi:hypothetical protein